jgi:hypothetical protein
VFVWAVVLTFALALISIRQRVSRSELEGTLLTYLTPISYGVGLWLFFNWLILGSPLFFLKAQTPGAPLSPGATASTFKPTTDSPVRVAERIVSLNWHLFPAIAFVLAALALVAVKRRDVMTSTLIALLTLNAAFTWLIIVGSGAEAYLELRYNMRAMPIAVAAIAWLYLVARPSHRTLVWAASVVILLASIPSTLHTMRSFKYQFREVDFVNAVEGKGGLPDQLHDERTVARWVSLHANRKDEILTDDSQTFAVMLLSGRPDLFFDRIDFGDTRWLEVRDRPFGRVRYMLATQGADLITIRYPGIAQGAYPGLTPVLHAGKYVIVRVARTAPSSNR